MVFLAADRVLDHATKATPLEDIEARIAELEQAIGREDIRSVVHELSNPAIQLLNRPPARRLEMS